MATLNERRKQETRLDIAEVALGLFAQHGYQHVTAELIAEESGVSLRTFYRYFPAKNEVLEPVVELRAMKVVDALAKRPREEPLALAVQRAIESLDAAWSPSSTASPIMTVLRSSPTLLTYLQQAHSTWEEPLARVVQERLGPACTHDQAVSTAAVIVAALRVSFQRMLADDAPTAFLETLKVVLAYIGEGAGLATKPTT